MKRMRSMQYKLNLFMLGMIISLTIVISSMSISAFVKAYDEDMMNRMQTAADTLYENLIVGGENKLSEYLELVEEEVSVHLNSAPERTTRSMDNFINNRNDTNILYLSVWNLTTQVYEYHDAGYEFVEVSAPEYQTQTIYGIEGDDEYGILIVATAPVFDTNNEIVGGIRVVSTISSQKEINTIKRMSGFDATIFVGDKRYITTIKQDGNYIEGTTMDALVADQVLEQGKSYIGKASVVGSTYMAVYQTIEDAKHNPVGAIFVGTSIASAHGVIYRTLVYVVIASLIIFALFFWYSKRWMSINIGRPITWLTTGMKKIAEQEEYSLSEDMPRVNNREMEILESSMKLMTERIFQWKHNLETIAYTDTLTGLRNREYLYERYSDVSLVKNNATLSVMFFLDVDNMKNINHIYGNRIGDLLIVQITETLKYISEGDGYDLFRVAGDEFVLCKSGEISIMEIHNLAKRILYNLDVPFEVAEYSINATVSLGISYSNYCEGDQCDICDGHCKDTMEGLFKKAEIAMNTVKYNGKNNYKIFDPVMEEDIKGKTILKQQLKTAIGSEELMLYYQPKYKIDSGEFDGFEALIRWKHPEKGFISPLLFIGIAEESGLIIELGAWVLETACRFIRDFNHQFHQHQRVAVNVSAIQLLSEGFEDRVLEILNQVGLEPECLELEITESVLMNSLEQANVILEDFIAHDISIALDDFGTGFSSLTYLRKLPITTLKLDKSFVDDIVTNDIAYRVVTNVVQLGKSMGLSIVVEGVEETEQYEKLTTLGCDYIQGYLFSRPLPDQQVYELFASKL